MREAGEIQGAKTLLLRVLDQPGVYPFEVAFAHELLGDLAAQQGARQVAANYYALVLDEQPSLSATTGTVEISLARLLLDGGDETDRTQVLDLLNSWFARPGMKFDSQLFRWSCDYPVGRTDRRA